MKIFLILLIAVLIFSPSYAQDNDLLYANDSLIMASEDLPVGQFLSFQKNKRLPENCESIDQSEVEKFYDEAVANYIEFYGDDEGINWQSARDQLVNRLDEDIVGCPMDQSDDLSSERVYEVYEKDSGRFLMGLIQVIH